VRGQFIAEGSELDLELKAELKGTPGCPAKQISSARATELQKLGEALLTLRTDLMARLALPEKLLDGHRRSQAHHQL
jgi:ribosome-associated protein